MKINKKSLKVLILAIVAIIFVVICIMLVQNKTIETTLGEKVWIKGGEELEITDAGEKVVLKINSKLDFDENAEEYTYEVPFELKVNNKKYSGVHTFFVHHQEKRVDKDIPYDVQILEFKNGMVRVQINKI